MYHDVTDKKNKFSFMMHTIFCGHQAFYYHNISTFTEILKVLQIDLIKKQFYVLSTTLKLLIENTSANSNSLSFPYQHIRSGWNCNI